MALMLPRLFTPPLRDLDEPGASWGHDLIWFCRVVLLDPLSDWQEWLAIHALEVLTRERAVEFALLEDDPTAELAKVDRLYSAPVVRGGRPIPNGRLRFTKIVILIARQNGKTDFVKKLLKWALFRKRMPEVMAAAQTLGDALDLWEEVVKEIEEHPKLSKQYAGKRLLNSQQQMSTIHACRYRPVGINERSGRGKTLDMLYIDELRTQKDFVGVNSLEPTTSASDNGLIITTSNAGANHSVVLKEYRELAMKPILEESWPDTRLGLFEWSADPQRGIDDQNGWRQANPDLGNGRITIAALLGYRSALSENAFRTEHLCQWVDELTEDIEPIFAVDAWKRRAVDTPVRLGYRCLAVEISPVTGRTKFVSAGGSALGFHLEVAPYEEQMTVEDMVAKITDFVQTNDPVAVVVDDKTDAVNLVEPLRRVGIEVVVIGYANVGKAYRLLTQLHKDNRLTNDGDPAWAWELGTTKLRQAGEGREVLIDRFKGEPQCLVAASLALWGLEVFSPVTPQVGVKTAKTVIRGASMGVVKQSAPGWAGSSGRQPGKWS